MPRSKPNKSKNSSIDNIIKLEDDVVEEGDTNKEDTIIEKDDNKKCIEDLIICVNNVEKTIGIINSINCLNNYYLNDIGKTISLLLSNNDITSLNDNIKVLISDNKDILDKINNISSYIEKSNISKSNSDKDILDKINNTDKIIYKLEQSIKESFEFVNNSIIDFINKSEKDEETEAEKLVSTERFPVEETKKEKKSLFSRLLKK